MFSLTRSTSFWKKYWGSFTFFRHDRGIASFRLVLDKLENHLDFNLCLIVLIFKLSVPSCVTLEHQILLQIPRTITVEGKGSENRAPFRFRKVWKLIAQNIRKPVNFCHGK